MATYKVGWEEKSFVKVEADDKEEAESKVMSGNFDEEKVKHGEILAQPEAHKVD